MFENNTGVYNYKNKNIDLKSITLIYIEIN